MNSFKESKVILYSSENPMVAEQRRFRCMVKPLTYVYDLWFGTWHTPPCSIDSIFQIGGVVIYGSDASDTKNYFNVCRSWLGAQAELYRNPLTRRGL